ncbi:bifunctional glutamate N-acetyltransferase/amino-acid acetyltransferase ArgJ [Marinicrinis sediminis]|uniref:Arginine biosynthesis bifunctional protein ArgJ n=1 Tax=Marinicrinis sediminis TaxID=1652465 RepID=A0ABW5RBJ1_9BACL
METEKYQVLPEEPLRLPKGFLAGGLHCGLKKTERHDLGAIVCEVPAVSAAVYTTNLFQAAPLTVTRDSLSAGEGLRAVIVNSGNANACTGKQGLDDARKMRESFAEALQISAQQVAVSSTGVIGELMPMEKVMSGIERLPAVLNRDGGEDFCQSILTTDLVKKTASVIVTIDGQPVMITGVAKGSGMIHPNMATMLGFITTDAVISEPGLHALLKEMTDATFNMITVDGDTSTNDMVLAMASGQAEHLPLHEHHPDWLAFKQAFAYVAEVLAKAIARDGEGATKLVEVTVSGAPSTEAARAIAKTIMGSSLVKTALFGADANWGRIIACVGRAGVVVATEQVDIRLGEFSVLEKSRPVPFDDEAATEYLKTADTVTIEVDLHDGEYASKAWGCDLTYEYVRINAAYRT